MATELIVLVVTFIAAILSSMSGGGTSIINIPIFLALGMSYPLAAATVLVNSTFWVLPASRNYLKGRAVDWRFIIFFSLIGLIGCYLGVLLVVAINQRILEIAVGMVILFLIFYTYIKKDLGLKERKQYSTLRQMASYPFALILGFYETIFGSGNGIAFTMLTVHTKGFDFIDALGSYYAISFSWALFSAILLIGQGYYDLHLMPFAVVGSVLGAYIGSRYAKKRGNRFIKIVFAIVGGVLGIKLLIGI